MCIRDRCLDVRPFTAAEATQAETKRLAEQPEFDDLPDLVSYQAATEPQICLLYTSDAADERSSVDLGGRRIIKKKRSRV